MTENCTVLPGAKVPRLPGARVLYRDGIAQAALVAGEFQPLATLSGEDERAFRRALMREPDPFDFAAFATAAAAATTTAAGPDATD